MFLCLLNFERRQWKSHFVQRTFLCITREYIVFLAFSILFYVFQLDFAASSFASFIFLSSRSLKRSLKSPMWGRIRIVYLTNSSMQSTRRSRFPLGMSRWSPGCPSSGNCVYALGIEDWFGIVNIRIHRPRIRKELTALNDWDPPHTWAIASVRPWVGRTLPVDRGIQSIWFLNTAV